MFYKNLEQKGLVLALCIEKHVLPQHKALHKPGAEVTMRTEFLGRVEHKHSKLAIADYFPRIIATFVVRMNFWLLKVKVSLICATQG